MIKLSLLICTLPNRKPFFDRLIDQIALQETEETEVLYNGEVEKIIGAKRNEMLQAASGQYVASIDDDDRISDNYISLLMEGINKGVDCCSLKGVITEDGKNPFIFEHSIKYTQYRTNEKVVANLDMEGWNMPHKIRYERYPNHLNCIRSSIAKQFRFPEINHGEDTSWATQIFKSGLIKTEHYIPEVIYFYEYRSKK